MASLGHNDLTHWGRVTHICVDKLTVISSNNGLSPGRRQDIIRTNAAILLIGSLGTNFSEISIKFHTFSFKKMHLKMASAKWRLFCLGLNVLRAACSTKMESHQNTVYTRLTISLILILYDDGIKWKHFPRYWPFVRGIHWSLVDSPHKGQWCRALMFSLICAWANSWINNGDTSDLRCHRVHYDVIVMMWSTKRESVS